MSEEERLPLLKKANAKHRESVRGSKAFPFFSGKQVLQDDDDDNQKEIASPVVALSPLIGGGGGAINIDGMVHSRKPPSPVKSIPAYCPYRRTARHRSFYLWWINQFRHWWKSSRLLVRLGGLETLSITIWANMILLPATLRHKGVKHAFKFAKRLGQGGVMRNFLGHCHPFTRALRLLVAIWRWIESAQCRRLEVGVEEAMAFMGNRVSRMLARSVVDYFNKFFLLLSRMVFRNKLLPKDNWHPAILLVLMGILRAVSPFAASFQGSRVGRVLTRAFFRNSKNRWLPVQEIDQLNLRSDDCCEQDEIDENSDLARLAKKVAKALGVSQQLGVDRMDEQDAALTDQGFRQVGAGSGGYAVYECHRRVSSSGSTASQTIFLHVTPYGPSLLNVMPRYIVLELLHSRDRRSFWSETIASWIWEGPSVLEGYCYEGAFFSPHHFAEMKETYDKQLLAYDKACQAMSKVNLGHRPGPPSDPTSLKLFLADGKLRRKRKKNDREYEALQKRVTQVSRRLKQMMTAKNGCVAPRGVILYFEGLDCSGKSSTGGLVQQALEQAGFDVELVQYNRPPTPEQQLRPWMDRFKVPETNLTFDENGKPVVCDDHRHKAVVWDRGPAGDFVYGALRTASQEEKMERYREFMAFDAECRKNNILFCKLMFVTNRDSIASTLGKRLAQRKMAQDLRTWLQASRGTELGETSMEGIDEIELHIDPTDFIAFNMYLKNLHMFSNFALNTDSSDNRWVVVNTSDRFNARKQLLNVFQAQLDSFDVGKQSLCGLFHRQRGAERDTPGIEMDRMLASDLGRRFRTRTPLFLMCLLVIVWYYVEHTQFDSFAGFPFKE